MTPENKYRGNGKVVDKDALQEIVYGAQLTTEGLCQGLQGNRNLTYRNQHFCSEVVLTKDYIMDIKDKRYTIKVVTIAKKLPPDGFEGQLRQSTESAGQRQRD